MWDTSQNIAPCKGIWISESGKFSLVNSGIQGFGIRNTAYGIRNPTNDWNQNPRSTDKGRNPVPGIRNRRCGIHNSRVSLIPFHWAKNIKDPKCPSKIAAIHLGSQWRRKFKISFRKISPWLTAYREHFDGILVITGTFAIQNRLESYMEDLKKSGNQL